MFTGRYGLMPYITLCFVFKGLTSLVFITEGESVYSAVLVQNIHNFSLKVLALVKCWE